MEQFVNLLQEFAFNLAVIALPILAAFLIALLNAWVKKVLAEVEANKPSLYWAMTEAVGIAVRAAEKMDLSTFVGGKKAYALEVAQGWLNGQGWEEVDIFLLSAAIEAAVIENFPD